MAPNTATVFSIAFATEASSATLVCTKITFSPSSLATASPASWLKSKIATLAPAATKRFTVASPRPEAPPVITATDCSNFILLLPCYCSHDDHCKRRHDSRPYCIQPLPLRPNHWLFLCQPIFSIYHVFIFDNIATNF